MLNPARALRALALLLLSSALLALLAHAEAPAAATPGPRTYALVSAVGNTFGFVRQKKQVGTSLEPYQRFEREIPGIALDAAVLRGLERVVGEEDPGARFVYLKLNPRELDRVYAYQRGEVAIGKLATALERMPERREWHRIVVVTPRYMNSGRSSLGEKLHGVGVFVQPMEKVPASRDDLTLQQEMARTPEGRQVASSRFVAPYFYAQVWVLDAATLRVLETSERWDFEKLADPKSTRSDIEDDFPPEVLGPLVERFVELSTANAVREIFSTVTVSEPKAVTPAR